MDGEKQQNKLKKQIPLRLAPSLYADLMQWAEEDFRSLNGQIEYLLMECVKQRKKNSEEKWEKKELCRSVTGQKDGKE